MNFKGAVSFLAVFSVFFLCSCTKINESSEVGIGLIPDVDNINTFDTTINVNARYLSFDDSTKNLITDYMALGQLNDPVFGTTTADMYFNLSSTSYGVSPFLFRRPVVAIDSVVLSLAYRGAYGDSSITPNITVAVSEINPGNGFVDSLLYRYDNPGFSTGASLGTKVFNVHSLHTDSIKIGNRPRDSSTVIDVLRIPLNKSLGVKLSQFDSAAGQPYYTDSLFRAAFRGLAVKTTAASGNGTLAYFNLSDVANTRLIVYYKGRRDDGTVDTTSAVFTHNTYAQANSIRRSRSSIYAMGLGNPAATTFNIQSASGGSYVSISIPALSTLNNRVINKAELIATKVPSTADDVFTPPSRLLLDHKGPFNTKDSANIFDNDLAVGSDGSLNFASFGGTIHTDNTYHFNITRYVQGLVTNGNRNDTLRLYAPLRSTLYSKTVGGLISISNLGAIAAGRVVIAGALPADPNRLRLRIVYSKF